MFKPPSNLLLAVPRWYLCDGSPIIHGVLCLYQQNGHLNNSCPFCFRFCNLKYKLVKKFTVDFNKGSYMTTCLGKSCSFGLLCVSFVNVNQLVCVFLSLLVLRVGCACLS